MADPATLLGCAGKPRGLRVAAGVPRVPPPDCRVTIMGLPLPNPLGLAAGFDRDDVLLPQLHRCGFALIEVGTVMTSAESHSPDAVNAVIAHLAGSRGPCSRGRCGRVPVGVNFAIWNDGCGAEARLDFVAAPCAARDALMDTTRYAVPLAVKLALDPVSLRFVSRVKATGLDAVTGVAAEPMVVTEAAQTLAQVPLISVGGICSAAAIVLRLACSATVIRIHRAFARGGPHCPRRVLANLEAMRRPQLPDQL